MHLSGEDIRTFTQRGGLRFGTLNATWPFASLTATPGSIWISCFGFKLQYPKTEISGLRLYRGHISTGLLVEHQIRWRPRFIVFWTFNFKALSENLEQLGYRVSDRA